MDPRYARLYSDLWKHHWWWRARRRWILDTLLHVRPPGGWERILDVGCGAGLFFPDLMELGQVEGVEPDPHLAAQGPHSERIHVAPFDERLELSDPYSLILMLDVLEHLEAPIETLSQAANLLAPQGILFVTVPAFNMLWTNHDILNRHRTRYRRRELEYEARAAGLHVLESRYFFHWLVPIKVGVRLVESLAGSKPTPPRVPPKPLNALFYGITRLEQRLSRVLSIPIGTSLLLIAKREDSLDGNGARHVKQDVTSTRTDDQAVVDSHRGASAAAGPRPGQSHRDARLRPGQVFPEGTRPDAIEQVAEYPGRLCRDYWMLERSNASALSSGG